MKKNILYLLTAFLVTHTLSVKLEACDWECDVIAKQWKYCCGNWCTPTDGVVCTPQTAMGSTKKISIDHQSLKELCNPPPREGTAR